MAKKDWTRLVQCESDYDNFSIPDITKYSEVLFTLQRSDGRTTGSTVIPVPQFIGGAVYAIGIEALENVIRENGVCVWLSNTSIEIAGTYATARFFAR